jgi:recombination protein RecR
MEYPSKVFQKSVEALSQFPGIGRHTAVRLTLHLLKQPISNVENIANAFQNLVNKIVYCQVCHNISENSICHICSNQLRNKNLICVVEDLRDVLAIENTQQFGGVYHVLGGKISPMEGIGPMDLNILSLKNRINSQKIEIIFALSSTIEGDTTSFYIYRLLKDFGVKFSCISRGIGVGEELEFTDSATLARSIQNRISYQINDDSL